MPKSLQSRKRQLVRDAIYDAAIVLFAKKGFDNTTVEEVAEAAGISRRSFFRYFESKDDLLALNTVNLGEIVCAKVSSSPAGLGLLGVVREAILTGVNFTKDQEHTREIIEIAQRSSSARQAHLSRLMDVNDRLMAAFAANLKIPTRDFMTPSLLAGLSQLVLNTSTGSWYLGQFKDLPTAAENTILCLTRIFCDPRASLGANAASSGKSSGKSALKKAAKKK